MKKLLFFISALSILFSNNIFSQENRYSQAFANHLLLNPAIMGASYDFKVNLNYRDQWANIQNGYKSYSLNLSYPLSLSDINKLDIGVSGINYKAGAYNNLNFNLAFGFNKRVATNHYISIALIGGYVQKNLDVANLTFDEQYVLGSFNKNNANGETTLNNKKDYADVGFGALWYFNPSQEDGGKINTYLGISGYHLNKPNESFTNTSGQLPIKYNYFAGIKILGANKIDITPNVKYTFMTGYEEFAAGIYLDYKFNDKDKFTIASWYKRNDAIAFLVGIEWKKIGFCYSYDVVSSDLKNYVSGLNSHEVSFYLKINRALNNNIKAPLSPFPSF